MERLRVLRNTLVGTALAACGLMQAHAQFLMGEQAAVIQTVTTSVYLNGGVGADEQATMRRVATEFPLRITFSEGRDGQFLADIPMVIQDAGGNAIFALRKAGPMLFVVLPPGRYKVSAGLNGETQTQQVTVEGKGGKDLHFRWAARTPKGQVWTAARD
jgi:hypothetical protein